MNFIKTCLAVFVIPEVQDKYIGFVVGMLLMVGIGCICVNPDIAKIPKFANETVGLKEIWKDQLTKTLLESPTNRKVN